MREPCSNRSELAENDDPFSVKWYNCLSESEPERIQNDNIRKVLEKICPTLFDEDKNPPVCCSENQVLILKKDMGAAEAVLSGCSPCYLNFRILWCQMTCSPNQHEFIVPIETWRDKYVNFTQKFVEYERAKNSNGEEEEEESLKDNETGENEKQEDESDNRIEKREEREQHGKEKRDEKGNEEEKSEEKTNNQNDEKENEKNNEIELVEHDDDLDLNREYSDDHTFEEDEWKKKRKKRQVDEQTSKPTTPKSTLKSTPKSTSKSTTLKRAQATITTSIKKATSSTKSAARLIRSTITTTTTTTEPTTTSKDYVNIVKKISYYISDESVTGLIKSCR